MNDNLIKAHHHDLKIRRLIIYHCAISTAQESTEGLRTNLRVLGQASEDMKMDSVMSSRTWSRNSALAQASVVDSILLGLSSQDCRDSMILDKRKVSVKCYFRQLSGFLNIR